MAETSFLFTAEDKIELAAWLIDEFDAEFVLDDGSETITRLSGLTDLEPELTSAYPRLIFVLSEIWSKHTLHKQFVDAQHEGGVYFVRQRYGGPAFAWMLGNCFERANKLQLSAGIFGDFPHYFVQPNRPETIERPPQMKDAYLSTKGKIKSLCAGQRTYFRAGNSIGPWISTRARIAVQSGDMQLANENLIIQPDAA